MRIRPPTGTYTQLPDAPAAGARLQLTIGTALTIDAGEMRTAVTGGMLTGLRATLGAR